MLYHFELQMAGVILLTAMLAGGIVMWYRRRREAALSGEGLDITDGGDDSGDHLR